MYACHRGRFAVSNRRSARASVLMALVLAAGSAAAEEDAFAATEQALTAQAGAARPMLEIASSEVPRFDSGDASTRASRTRVTLFPAARSAVGFSVGLTNTSGPSIPLGSPYVPGGPMLDLGLHWRHERDGAYRLDITAWRRVGAVDAISMIQSQDQNYGARVEMSFASGKPGPRKGFVAERGFVGFQLDGGARVTFKRSGGRPMLYYRSNF
jgi:hypothetical protein